MILWFVIASMIGFLIAILIAIYAYWPLRSIPNDNLEAAIAESSKLINKANYELKVVSGTLYPGFYNAEPISRALEDRVNHGLKIKILYGPRADLSKVPKLSKLYEEGAIMIRRLNREPRPHFMVCDGGRHIRLEGIHSEETADNPKAKIIYNSVEIGWRYNRLFDELWNEAQPEQKANIHW